LGVHRHVASGWAVSLASWLEQAATTRGIGLSLIALGADGILPGVEAWALARGARWGAWLVVLATGSLLPFDVLRAGALAAAGARARARRERRARRLPGSGCSSRNFNRGP